MIKSLYIKTDGGRKSKRSNAKPNTVMEGHSYKIRSAESIQPLILSYEPLSSGELDSADAVLALCLLPLGLDSTSYTDTSFAESHCHAKKAV